MFERRFIVFFVAAALVGSLLPIGLGATPVAAASPPPNDNFADATTIIGNSGAIDGTNVDATFESGENATCTVSPSCFHFTGPAVTVWYSWTAPNDGTATFDTCSNPTYDTTLSVYSGSAYPLTKVTDNEDACGPGGVQSWLSFTATAGLTYSIQVDGWQGRSGTFTLTWNLPVPPPAGSLSPAGNDFGSRHTGTSSAAFGFTLSNTGGSQLASIDISIVGTDPGQFSVSGTTCGTTLAAGHSCTIDVTHAPTDVGTHSATLQVTSDDPGGADTASLAGGGTAPPATLRQPDGLIRNAPYGAWRGNDIHNTDATDQTVNRTVRARRWVNFTVRILNDGDTAEAFMVGASDPTTNPTTNLFGPDDVFDGSSAGFRVRYYDHGVNITDAIVAGTYETPILEPGDWYQIKVKVRVNGSAEPGAAVERLLTISSVGDAGAMDAVMFSVARRGGLVP